MFKSFFKKSVSSTELAGTMWNVIRNWPSEHSTSFRQNFENSFDRPTDEIFDEIVYFLAFAADYAFYHQLQRKPKLKSAVRSAFMTHLNQFAHERRCSPVPSGSWIDDSLIWMPHEAVPGGEPLTNLQKRFALYGEALSRRHDRSAGERTAHLLAAWSGTMDATFIAYASPFFVKEWSAVKDVLNSFSLRV